MTATVGAAMLVGVLGGSLLQITAANADTTNATASAIPSQSGYDPSKGGHTANGITEQLLTGDTAVKAKAAALVAVPGGTIQRVEIDAEGAAYEAHMTMSDGSKVTVKMDGNFKVTGIENGMGPMGIQSQTNK